MHALRVCLQAWLASAACHRPHWCTLAADTKKQAGFNTKGIGTGSYMAPEIIMAHHVASDGKVMAPYGKKADAFAVGCVVSSCG